MDIDGPDNKEGPDVSAQAIFAQKIFRLGLSDDVVRDKSALRAEIMAEIESKSEYAANCHHGCTFVHEQCKHT